LYRGPISCRTSVDQDERAGPVSQNVKWSIVALLIIVVALYCFIEGGQPVLGTLLLGSDLERYMQAKPEAAAA